jgi:hypothetical protein
LALWWHSAKNFNEIKEISGGEGRESNPPATAMAARPVLKTGGATGPLPPPSPNIQGFFSAMMQSGSLTLVQLWHNVSGHALDLARRDAMMPILLERAS